MTLEEHDAALGGNEEVPRREARIIEEMERDEAITAEAEEPLLQDLRAAGIQVESVWDFVNIRMTDRAAVPILVSHLDRTYPPGVVEGMARALTIAHARSEETSAALVRAFRATQDEHLQFAIGNALSVTATHGSLPDLLELVHDQENKGRRMLVRAVARLQGRDAVPVLVHLLDDSDKGVIIEAIRALGRKRALDAVGALRGLANSTDRDIQRPASKALERITQSI